MSKRREGRKAAGCWCGMASAAVSETSHSLRGAAISLLCTLKGADLSQTLTFLIATYRFPTELGCDEPQKGDWRGAQLRLWSMPRDSGLAVTPIA